MKTPGEMRDEMVMCALIGQVCSARENGVETEVVTIITRPMWNAFLRGAKMAEDSSPTVWKGSGTIRVFGSETIVVESDEWWSASRRRQ